MEIKDIDRYVREISGINANSNLLGEDEEPFLSKLMGTDINLTKHVKNISGFAGSSMRQLFYEMLQNANDEGATTFNVWFDDSKLLILNNGKPFELNPLGTDRKKKDDLRAFLEKEKSPKYGDQNTIGEFGLGSKLLYNLLTDEGEWNQQEALGQAILNDYKGLILFSWSDCLHLQGLRTLNVEKPLNKTSRIYGNDTPILTKIIFTYFPVLPGEQYTVNKEKKVLFTAQELKHFISSMDAFFSLSQTNESEFSEGSALFVMLGEGKNEAVKDAVDTNLLNGIRTSLPLLNRVVKSVQINEQRVSKSSAFYEAKLTVKGNKTGRVLWPESLDAVEGDFVNFFQFFPIANEVHGLNLIVDSKAYKITNSRQNIDLDDPYSKTVLEDISGAFKVFISNLKNPNDETKLISLIQAIVRSKPSESTEKNRYIKRLFYDDLLPVLKTRIPTNSGIKNNHEQACILNLSNLNVSLKDLGTEDMYWVADGLQDVASELSSVLGIEIWGISDILKAFTSSDARDEWVNNLPEQDYQNIIEELKGFSPARIRELPFLKFSDRKVYSFNQALDSEMLVLLDEKAYPIKEILIKCGFTVGGREVLQSGEKGLLEKLASSIPNPLARWKAIWAKIDAASLLHTEKWQVFRTLRDNWEVPEEYLGDELLLFKNREGVLQPLSKMLKAGHSHAPSGILKPFELFPTEQYHDELDAYMMKSKHIWNTLTHSWEKIKPEISLQNYMQVLKDLEKLFQKKEIGNKLQDQEWLMNPKGNLVSRDNIFYSTSIAALPQDQYSSLSTLIKRITDNLNLVPFNFLVQLSQINFAELPNSSLRNLAEKISKDNSQISPSEAKLLFDLNPNQESFFSTFKIREVDENILLVNNQSGIQFHANDAKLSNFLKGKSNYFELPQPLYETFKEDGGLKRDYGSGVDEFARKLMVDFGAQKEFIDLVLRCNQETKALYLNKIKRFELSTKGYPGEYGRASFEVKLIGLARPLNQLENLRNKTYVDDIPLSSLIYEDKVELKGNDLQFSFGLSGLIEKYASQALTINRLRKKFSNQSEASKFLETKLYPKDSIFHEIISDQVLANPERVSFIAAYLLTQPENHNDQNLRNLNWLSLNKAKVLSSLYGHEMDSFEQVIGSYYWTPKNHIYAPDDDSFLLESEKLPAWAKEWLNGKQERLKFLKAAGLRTVDDPTLVFRKAVLSGESLSGTAIADAANQPQPENTLKWLLGRNHISEYRSASHRLINNYIDKLAVKSDALPPYLQRFNTNGRLAIQEMTPPYNALSLSDLKEEDLSIIPDVVSKTDRALVDIDFLSTDIQKLLEANGIPLAFLEKEITDQNANDLQEWSLGKYKEWKKDYDKYTIRTTQNAVPLTYYLKYEEEEKEISIRSIETSIRHNRRDGHIDLIVFQEENKSVLEAIQEAKEELFEGDYKSLTDLLAKFAVNDKDQLILDIIKDNGVTKEKLEEMLREGSLVNEPPPTYQEGSPDGTRVKIDITEEERQKIENSSEAIKKMLNQATESELNEISQRLQEVKDFMEGTEHKSSPSLLIGYIGEILVVEWLKLLGDKSEVNHVALNENHRPTKTPFDIELIIDKRRFEIDVKTTIKPLHDVSDSVAFFVSRIQYDHIANNPDDNYFIFRISLEDLGLTEWYHKLKNKYQGLDYQEIIDAEKENILARVHSFLETRKDLLKTKRMYFKLSVPQVDNMDVPF
jgi:phosphopantetheine adenylyltransferase